MENSHYRKVNRFIEELMVKIYRPAEGLFRYPSLTTTAGKFYSGGMFTWDTHHMTLRFAMAGKPECRRMNFVKKVFRSHLRTQAI